jgi:succinyl-diaminopimelate desuccinylase
MNQELSKKIDAFIEKNREQILADIASLVAINSVQTAPEENAPFGAGAKAALEKTLELAAGMGLATKNCDNYIGYAELAGAETDKYLATICHVDVVPAGNGWDADPFTMRVRDGWLLGRGVSDDKGPMVTTLYALKFLKRQRRDRHEGRGVLSGPRAGPGVLLHARRGVPRVQRRKGPLRRKFHQPTVRRRGRDPRV